MNSSIQNCVFVGQGRTDGLAMFTFPRGDDGLCYVNLDGYLIAPLDKAFWVPDTTSKWRTRALSMLFVLARKVAGNER